MKFAIETPHPEGSRISSLPGAQKAMGECFRLSKEYVSCLDAAEKFAASYLHGGLDALVAKDDIQGLKTALDYLEEGEMDLIALLYCNRDAISHLRNFILNAENPIRPENQS